MKPRKLKKSTTATLDETTVSKLSDAVAPVTPPDSIVARMRKHVMENATALETVVVRAEAGEWRKMLPGITIKTLHVDVKNGTQTSLWRLEAGARVPPHPHTKEEECLVLEGSIIHDGITYRQGDFLLAMPGVRHRDFIAPEGGALLMIRGERIPNKLLLNAAMLLPH